MPSSRPARERRWVGAVKREKTRRRFARPRWQLRSLGACVCATQVMCGAYWAMLSVPAAGTLQPARHHHDNIACKLPYDSHLLIIVCVCVCVCVRRVWGGRERPSLPILLLSLCPPLSVSPPTAQQAMHLFISHLLLAANQLLLTSSSASPLLRTRYVALAYRRPRLQITPRWGSSLDSSTTPAHTHTHTVETPIVICADHHGPPRLEHHAQTCQCCNRTICRLVVRPVFQLRDIQISRLAGALTL